MNALAHSSWVHEKMTVGQAVAWGYWNLGAKAGSLVGGLWEASLG